MNQRTKLPPCGNPKCRCSTGIHDGLTYGSGELNDYGYWEHPCEICADAHDEEIEKKYEENVKEIESQVIPYIKLCLEQYKKQHNGEEPDMAKFRPCCIRTLVWQNIWRFTPGWPFKENGLKQQKEIHEKLLEHSWPEECTAQ